MRDFARRIASSDKMRSRSVEIATAIAITVFALVIITAKLVAIFG